MSPSVLLFLPGLTGSELYLSNNSGNRVKAWLDPSSIFWGTALEALQWGNTPPGLSIVAGEPLELNGWGYPGLLRTLQAILAPFNLNVMGAGYDFRDGVMNNGTRLANGIRGLSAFANGIYLLTHSMGGLVAQAALAQLKSTGEQGLVKGVCAVCPPFAGSYGSVEVWREQESGPDLLGLANASTFAGFALGTFAPGRNPLGVQANNRQRAIALYESWPGTYDLLPNPLAADNPNDKLRAQVYLGSVWAEALVPPDVPLLLAAQGTTWPYLQANPPDPSVWTVVACVYPGVSTAYQLTATPTLSSPPASTAALLQNPFFGATLLRQSRMPGLLSTNQGDGRVTLASQMIWGLPSLLIQAKHEDAPSHPSLLANLPGLLHLPGAPQFPPVDLSRVFPEPIAA